MKIKSLTLQNYKAFGSQPSTFEFSDLNLIFGRNSAGKSTALQALKYFSSVLLGVEKNNIEKFNSIVNHNQEGGNPIIRVELHAVDVGRLGKEIPYNLINRSRFIEIEISNTYGSVVVSRCSAGYDGVPLISSRTMVEDEHVWREVEINYKHAIYQDELLIDEIIEQLENYKKVNPDDWIENFTGESKKEEILTQLRALPVLINSISEFTTFMEDYSAAEKEMRPVLDVLLDSHVVDESDNVPEKVSKPDKILRSFEELVSDNSSNVVDLYRINNDFPIYSHIENHSIPERSDFITGIREANFNNKKQAVVDILFLSPIVHLINLINSLPRPLYRQFLHVGPLRKQVSHVNSYGEMRHKWYDGSSAYYDLVNSDNLNIDSISSKLRLISESNSYTLSVEHYLPSSARNNSNKKSSVKEIRTLSLNTKSGSIVDFSQVGTGISQALPIIVALEHVNKTIILEQPELHLHPAITLHLADMIVDSVKNGNQIFIETHSEHIILRVLRHIREKRRLDKNRIFNPSNVSITYLDIVNGKLKPVNIAIDDDGDFVTAWPNGFFVERAKELF